MLKFWKKKSAETDANGKEVPAATPDAAVDAGVLNHELPTRQHPHVLAPEVDLHRLPHQDGRGVRAVSGHPVEDYSPPAGGSSNRTTNAAPTATPALLPGGSAAEVTLAVSG